MGNVHPIWEIKYGLGFETSYGVGVDAGTSIPTGGPKGIALTNIVAPFDPGVNVIDVRKATGSPYRRADVYEFQQGTESPTCTLEFQVDPTSIVPILASLFQTAGDFEGGSTTFTKIFTIYTSAPDFAAKAGTPLTAPFLLSIIKNMNTADESWRLVSSVCRSLTLSSEEGGPLVASAEFIGKDLEVNYNAAGTYTLPTLAPLLYQNCAAGTVNTTDVDDASPAIAITAVPIKTFSITMSNNATVRFDSNQNANQIILGDFTVEGSMTLPWGREDSNENLDIGNFITGTCQRWGFGWGTTNLSVTNSLTIATNTRLTGIDSGGDDEHTLTLNFIGVYEVDDGSGGEKHPIEIGVSDSINFSIGS